jgi:phosphatidate cytidylyltransferase
MSQLGGGKREESGGVQKGWPFGVTRLERKIGNGRTRVLVAIVAIPFLLLIFKTGGWAFSALMLVIAIGACFELIHIFTRLEARPYAVLLFATILTLHAITAAGLYTDVFAERSRGLLLTLLLLFIIAVLARSLADRNDVASRRGPATAFALVYVGVLPATVPVLYEGINHYLNLYVPGGIDGLPLVPFGNDSFEFILLIFATIWMCDTGAYIVGRAWGKRKLAPAISPNKTVEGAIGGLLFSIATSILIRQLLIDKLQLIDALAIGVIVAGAGQMGDLAESHLKRAAGLKDSSAIIPGHGGLLDRFDSLLLVAPSVLVYIMLRAFWFDISSI